MAAEGAESRDRHDPLWRRRLAASRGGYVFFDQVEVEGNVALRSDLFAARLPDGRA